jgi:hypothetical protein
MGKRELLLVLGFVTAGALVYQLTARPEAPGQRRFSLAGFMDHVKREVRGNRANAETTTTTAYALAETTSEVRVTFDKGNAELLEIHGEDRQDVEATLHVWSNGFDEEEARRLAAATVLNGSEAGARMTFALAFPKEARQRANITLRVPSKMRVSLGRHSGKLFIEKTGDVELADSRGDTKIRGLTGRLTGSHRGGDLDIADVPALKLTVRGTDVRIARVRGDVTVQAHAGEIRGAELEGPVNIDGNNTEVTLERLDRMRAPLHVTASGGSVTLEGLRSETRVDARNAEVVVSLARPAAVEIHAEGGEQVEVTVPPGGFKLDAIATAGGRITVPEGLVDVTSHGGEQRASGSVGAGGPTITVRATEGEIVLRGSDALPRAEAPEPPRPPRPPAAPDLREP